MNHKKCRYYTLFVIVIIFFISHSILASASALKLPPDKVRLYSSDLCATCKQVASSIDDISIVSIFYVEDGNNLEDLNNIYTNSAPNIPCLVIGDKVIDDPNEIVNILNNPESINLEKVKTIEVSKKKDLSLGVSVIALAGLIDGINPCAISMLLFLLSLLINTNEEKVIPIGVAYALGIFVIYFFIGIGLYKLIESFSGILTFRLLIYVISLIVLTVFLLKDLRDYINMKNGNMNEVKNELSKERKDMIHGYIKEAINSGKGIISMFILGAIVGLLEFSCTGQVYIPTISYMSQFEPVKGLILLFLYNVLFILPILIVVFLVNKSKEIISVSMTMYENRVKITAIKIVFYLFLIIYFIRNLISLLF